MGFYISGIYILFGTLTMFWNHYTPYDLGGIHLIFLIAYITYVAAALSAPPSFGRIFRSLLTGILSLLLYLSLAFGLSLLIVWIG